MKKFADSFRNSLSILEDRTNYRWRKVVVSLWVVVGIPVSLGVLLFGVLAATGVTQIEVIERKVSGLPALVGTLAGIVFWVPAVITIVGTIMWLESRFLK